MNNHRTQTLQITIGAILSAFAIMIPMIMPIRIIIGPASFTLASHVPIFIAMFLSPQLAIMVALVSSIGFFLAGFPIIIVARAFSHLLFAYIGARALLAKDGKLPYSKLVIFGIVVNIIHGLAEFLVVLGMSWTSQISSEFIWTMFGLVGVGTLVHGLVDFAIAYVIWNLLITRVWLNHK